MFEFEGYEVEVRGLRSQYIQWVLHMDNDGTRIRAGFGVQKIVIQAPSLHE